MVPPLARAGPEGGDGPHHAGVAGSSPAPATYSTMTYARSRLTAARDVWRNVQEACTISCRLQTVRGRERGDNCSLVGGRIAGTPNDKIGQRAYVKATPLLRSELEGPLQNPK